MRRPARKFRPQQALVALGHGRRSVPDSLHKLPASSESTRTDALISSHSGGVSPDQRLLSVDPRAALIIVDAQKGFFAQDRWGVPNNPRFESNLGQLIATWQRSGRAIVVVRHDSLEPGSNLDPDDAGNALINIVAAVTPDLLVTKSVNSAFLGTPSLADWLDFHDHHQIVLCGISTSTCVETTARMGQNLGFDVLFAIDATCGFPLTAADGTTLTADQLRTATIVNLSAGGFARIVTTADLVAGAPSP